MAGMIVTRIDLSGLERLTKELEPKAEGILDDMAESVVTQAKLYEKPWMTGALNNSIHVAEKRKMYRKISDDVPYGIWIELGHHSYPPHPFMAPAVEYLRPWFEKAWEALFK